MSYCRFHNTVNDLYDCKAVLEEEQAIENESERKLAVNLIRYCRKIADQYDGQTEQEILNHLNDLANAEDEDDDEK